MKTICFKPFWILLIILSETTATVAETRQRCIEARFGASEQTLGICEAALQQENVSADDRSIIFITIAEYLISQNRLDQANEVLDEAFNSNPKMLENGIFRYNWLRTKGNLYMVKQAYQNALPFYEQAYEIAVLMENPPLTSNSFNDLGAVNLEMGNFSQAILWFEQSLALHQSKNDNFRAALTLANIAEIYEKQQQYDKALEYLRAAEKSHQDNIVSQSDQLSYYEPYLARVQEDMGDIYRATNRPEQAQELLTSALEIFRNHDQKMDQVRILSVLSDDYLSRQQPQQALNLIEQAQQLEPASNGGNNIDLGVQQVQAYIQLQQLNTAESKALDILKLSRQASASDNSIQLLLLLSEIKEQQNDSTAALDYFRQYNQAQQDQLLKTYDASLLQLQSQIDLEQKQKEITLLEKNQTIRDLTIQQQRWIFSVIGLLLAVAVAILFFNLKRKNRERNDLESEIRSHQEKLQTLSIDTTDMHQLFSNVSIPLVCTDATGSVIFCTEPFQKMAAEATTGTKFSDGFPELWQYLLKAFNSDDKLEKDVLIQNDQIGDALPASINSVWIHQMRFLDDALVFLFIDEHNSHELALQTADQIRKFSAFNQSLMTTLSHTSDLQIQQSEQLLPITKAMQQLNKKLNHDNPRLTDNSSLKQALVDLMITCVETWQKSTETTPIDLAEKSGLWLIDIDSGRLRTRTMDRYTDIKKIPKIPRWRQVVKTAHFILSNCKLNIQERQSLNEKTETVMQIVRARALGRSA